MNETIDICVFEPNKKPEMVTIDNTLEAMQRIVGGYIQVVKPWGGDVVLVCNEEGKVLNLPINKLVVDGTGRVFDVIVGTFFLALAPRGCENFLTLPRFFADRLKKYILPVSCHVGGKEDE